MKFSFTSNDLKYFFNLLEGPDYSSVPLPRNNYAGLGRDFLYNFNVKLSESELRNLGVFVYRCIKVSRKNEDHLYEALSHVKKRKKKLQNKFKTLNEKIQDVKTRVIKEAEENEIDQDKKWIKGDSFEELSKEAQMWHGKIKFIGLKSFKTAWFRKVKNRSDIVYTDQMSDQAEIKYYYNKPIFSVPETLLQQMKRDYKDFNPGLYEYLEYLMFKIEKVKRKQEKNYALNHSIFGITSAKKFDDINPDNNFIVINTNGHDRPTYKGLPEFITRYDLKKMREYAKEPVNIPSQPEGDQLPGGGAGGAGAPPQVPAPDPGNQLAL